MAVGRLFIAFCAGEPDLMEVRQTANYERDATRRRMVAHAYEHW
jgi:nicotinamide mononucleotide (NMN) deamidase PncC